MDFGTVTYVCASGTWASERARAPAQWMRISIQLQWISGDILNANKNASFVVAKLTHHIRLIACSLSTMQIERELPFVKDCHEKIFSSSIYIYIFWQAKKKRTHTIFSTAANLVNCAWQQNPLSWYENWLLVRFECISKCMHVYDSNAFKSTNLL